MASRRLVKILYLIGFMDNFGVSMTLGFFIQSIRNHGISPSVIGIIGSVYGAVQIVSGPIIGILGDVYGRKTFLFLSYLFPSLGYLILGTTSSLALIVLSRVISGIFKHGQLCCRAYLTELTPSEEHTSVLGLFNASSTFGFIIGPLIGGQLAQWDPKIQLPFLIASLVLLLDSVLIVVLIPSSKKSRSIKSVDWRELFSSVNFLSKIDWHNQLDIIAYCFVASLSVLTFRKNYPILLEEVYGLNNYGNIGMVMSFSALIGVIASSLTGRVSKLYSSQKTILRHMTALMCVTMVTAAWSPWLPLTIACLVPLSLATSNLRVNAVKVMLSKGGEGQKGAILGINGSVISISRALCPSLVGVAQEFGSGTSGKMSAGLALASVGLAMVLGN